MVLYLPIGIEGGFKGLVDLVENRAIIWLEESLGAKFEYQEIPADLKDATEAARRWLDIATGRGVALVCAHTLAGENPSTGVLRRLGFRRTAELADPEVGAVWRWELTTGTRST